MSKFYFCEICGNLVEVVNEGGGNMICCGRLMTAIKENTVEASLEKHIPVAEIKDGVLTVKVGSVEHPMTEEHHISWIYIDYGFGTQKVFLKPGEKPEACFCICDAKDISVYAYCNLHGLWKAEIKA